MKKLVLGLVLGMVGMIAVHAQPVEITITGATAFRANAYRSIRNMFNAGFSQNPVHDASLAGRVTWTGTMPIFGTRPVTVRVGFSGSTAGIQSVTSGSTVQFLQSSTPGVSTLVSLVADFTFSDVFQSSSAFQTPTLVDHNVGVIPFAWVRGSSCNPLVTDVSFMNARAIFNAGYLFLNQFTGNPAHFTGEIVNVVGRNAGSGTRAATLAEIQLGPLAVITQRRTNALPSNLWVDDTTGQSSSALIPAQLNSGANNSADGPGGAISYLDLNDVATVVAGGGAQLTYNGVACTFNNVRNGRYSLWSYEHLMHLSTLPGDEGTFRDDLVSQIDTDLATSVSAIQTSTMNVIRLDDGATITP